MDAFVKISVREGKFVNICIYIYVCKDKMIQLTPSPGVSGTIAISMTSHTSLSSEASFRGLW
jgi:hypothetical protein